jgi:hypothetical protein
MNVAIQFAHTVIAVHICDTTVSVYCKFIQVCDSGHMRYRCASLLQIQLRADLFFKYVLQLGVFVSFCDASSQCRLPAHQLKVI